MKAVIMAGGCGSRLRPLTNTCPKPMLPIADKPILAYTLELLREHHFSEVIITVRYLADQIKDYFGDGRRLNMSIKYVHEKVPLGTAGGVKNAQPYLDNETFLVISGDIITNIDLLSVVDFHHAKQALATVAITNVPNSRRFGVVVTNCQKQIQGYYEKTAHPSAINMVNAGIYILEPDVLDYMDPEQSYDFSNDIFPQMIKERVPIYGFPVAGYWQDIGTHTSYQQAAADVKAGKVSSTEPVALTLSEANRAIVCYCTKQYE